MFSTRLKTTIVSTFGTLRFEGSLKICFLVNLVSHHRGKLSLGFTCAESANLELFLVVIGHVLRVDVLSDSKLGTEAFDRLTHLVGCIHWQGVALVLGRVEDADVVVRRLGFLLDISMHVARLVLECLVRALKDAFLQSSGWALLSLFLLLIEVEFHTCHLARRGHILREANKDGLLKALLWSVA